MQNPSLQRRFTPRDLLMAMDANRVHVLTNNLSDDAYQGDNLKDFPYAVLAADPVHHNWIVADAWRIAADGRVFSGHVSPVPIRRADAHPVTRDAAEQQHELLRYVRDSFVNQETELAAQALTSSRQAWDQILASPDLTGANWYATAERALNQFARANRRVLGLHRTPFERIDFAEIAQQFTPDCAPALPTASKAQPVRPPATTGPSGHTTGESIDGANGRVIDADVLAVLREATASGPFIQLTGQLDRSLYERVDAVLKATGAKWVGGSRRAHRYDDVSAIDMLEAMCATGRYSDPKDFGYFPTPQHLINRMLERANLDEGMQCLEPSAGDGRLALAMAAVVGGPAHVTVCELLDRNLSKLSVHGFGQVWKGDFLQVPVQRRFHAAVLNPPFSGHADTEHILHASRFVVPGGTVTAIASRAWLIAAKHKRAAAFRAFLDSVGATVEEVPAGAFKESGTAVATTLIHFTV